MVVFARDDGAGQAHVEGSTLTYAEIAKLRGVSATSVSRWKCRYGWKRPPGAFERRPIAKDRCAAAKRAMEDGARYQEVAVLMDRSPDIVRRLRRPSPKAGLAAAPGDADGADPLELVPELIDALTVRGLARDDVLRHAPGIFGVLHRPRPSPRRAPRNVRPSGPCREPPSLTTEADLNAVPLLAGQ